jgi:preprotein translocase subunit SecD
MLNFSKLKITIISLLSLLAILYALPSIFLNNKPSSLLEKYVPSNKVNLGLDLKGGSQLLLEVDHQYYLKEQLNNLKNEIREIFYEESIKSVPELVNEEKIIFTISNEDEINRIKKIIRKNNKNLALIEKSGNFEISFFNEEKLKIKQNLIRQSIEIIRRRVDENGTKEPTIISQGDNRILLQVPGIQNSAELKTIIGKTAKMTFHFLSENPIADNSIQLSDDKGRIYNIKKEVILSGDLLVDANATFYEGKPAVAFRFNSTGTRKFSQITKENIGKVFAIVLDNKVITAPIINTVINQGSGIISGNFTTQEANQTALLLRAGSLPAPLSIVEERTVGPSLGNDSIESGKIAIIASLIFVAIFMVVFYGLFGFIADIAMFINIAIIISILAFFNATLTLPGIAGIVLTMGMSVDANVLIFERIKEELKDQKSIFNSIEQGFSQAYRTIIDSNLTTLIVALFLYIFGNGPIKGFSVTLSIGIISSMFTAILLTRMIISIWIKKFKPKKLALL